MAACAARVERGARKEKARLPERGQAGLEGSTFGGRDQKVTALTRTTELIDTAASSAKTLVVIVRMVFP
jgi:uncharacterized protein YqhQ